MKKIPKRQYQVIAFVLLAIVATLFVLDIAWHRYLYDVAYRLLRPLGERYGTVLSVLTLFLVYVSVWFVIVIPIRKRSDMMTIGQELESMKGKGVVQKASVSFALEKKKLEDMKTTDVRTYSFRLALGGLIIFIASATAVFLFWYLEGSFYIKIALISLVSILVTVWYLVRGLISKPTRARNSDEL